MKRYRHPKEKTAALITFGLGVLASLFFVTVTFGCGLFLLGLGFAWVSITMFNKPRLDRYHRVDPNTLPELYNMVQQIRKKWRMGEIDIYLNPTRQMNASASDFGKDFLIVNQGLWMSIQGEAHRKFVIGHELGHIGLGHSWLRVLAYQADNAFQGSLLGILFQFLLLNYSRKKELSADRIGLLSCGNLTAALEVLAFLELSPQIVRQLLATGVGAHREGLRPVVRVMDVFDPATGYDRHLRGAEGTQEGRPWHADDVHLVGGVDRAQVGLQDLANGLAGHVAGVEGD